MLHRSKHDTQMYFLRVQHKHWKMGREMKKLLYVYRYILHLLSENSNTEAKVGRKSQNITSQSEIKISNYHLQEKQSRNDAYGLNHILKRAVEPENKYPSPKIWYQKCKSSPNWPRNNRRCRHPRRFQITNTAFNCRIENQRAEPRSPRIHHGNVAPCLQTIP